MYARDNDNKYGLPLQLWTYLYCCPSTMVLCAWHHIYGLQLSATLRAQIISSRLSLRKTDNCDVRGIYFHRLVKSVSLYHNLPTITIYLLHCFYSSLGLVCLGLPDPAPLCYRYLRIFPSGGFRGVCVGGGGG